MHFVDEGMSWDLNWLLLKPSLGLSHITLVMSLLFLPEELGERGCLEAPDFYGLGELGC